MLPSPIMALTPRNTWVRSKISMRPCLCIWGKRTSLSPSQRKLRLRQHLPARQTPRSTAIRGSVTPSLGIMERTTMPRRQRSPTGGRVNFYSENCDDTPSFQPPHGRLEAPSDPGLACRDAAKNIVPCLNNLEVTSMEVRTVNVQRWSVVSQKPFENVVAAVEAAIGRPNMNEFAKDVAAAATYPEMREVVQNAVSEIGLMEFMRLDVGAVLAKAHPKRDAKIIRLLIGNPLIMESMARLVPDAASYAPVTVLIDRRPDGVHLSYDEMASLLAPYGNAEAVEIAGDLDIKVRRMLQDAS